MDVTRFFAYLRTDYKPARKSGRTDTVSGSTLQNHWKAVRSFYNWATANLHVKRRPDATLRMPPNNPKIILPLTEQEIKNILKAAEHTDEVKPSNRSSFVMRRRTAERDVAIIMVLLDTGLRVGECGRLNVGDVNLETGEVYVAPFGDSQRKTKSRTVYVGKSAKKVIWRYLAKREELTPEDPLFLSEQNRRMDNNSIRHLLVDLGKRAGVKNLHPHRLRHTFAIEFLRGGGDVFSLPKALGSLIA